MKLIIFMQDGSVDMISVNQITNIVFCASLIKIFRIAREPKTYFYKDIKSMIIA